LIVFRESSIRSGTKKIVKRKSKLTAGGDGTP